MKDPWTAEEWEAWENEKKERWEKEMAIIDVGMGVNDFRDKLFY